MVAGLHVCPHNCAMVTAAQLYRTFTLLSLVIVLLNLTAILLLWLDGTVIVLSV